MEAENEYEIKRARDAIQTIETLQSMIDVSADRLEGLRTQCSTSAELTQQEIRTLEGKLVKHFSRQLVIKSRFYEDVQRALGNIPCLAQWLRVVGLGTHHIQTICSRVPSLEALRSCSEHELRALLPGGRDEELRRLCRAMQRLHAYTEALARGDGGAEMPLYWDSWERHGRASPRARPRASRDAGDSQHSTPLGNKGKVKSHSNPNSNSNHKKHLPPPSPPLSKSRSHESRLCVRDELSDNSQSSTVMAGDGSPPASPHELTPTHHNDVAPPGSHGPGAGSLAPAPRSPRTPTVGRCMAHDIAHRFTKTFNMIATCDYCDKQMLFDSGLKCKECKFKCHRDCESKVPPSCGLPPEFVVAFKEKFHKDGGGYIGSTASPAPARVGLIAAITQRPQRKPRRRPRAPPPHMSLGSSGLSAVGVESSSNTSSCNSSTPSSPAPPAPAPPAPPTPHRHKHQFHFPEVASECASPAHAPPPPPHSNHSERSRCVSLSGSGSTDSGGARADSLELANKNDARWPRQNSLSMKEWDIPYDELKLFEKIGDGRFGTVYRGSWHGAVAVKLLHVISDHTAPLDTFKHEVATFRKTRHENLVLFMGACMQPPRLAIVTSLCKGNTLYTHIHARKDKFTNNKAALVAQQISQGMGYLHARGIIHKDLKTKNIFLENGKVVITDFGLFSVTKLCFGNNARGDSLGIPPGWLCYLAPELIRALRPHASLHLPFSKATDVYAFGTVWYELLCGEFPFKGQPPEAIIWQAGRGVKQSLANMQSSRDIKDILMLCWSYRASDRPDFPHLLSTLEKLPRKRLARSPSHPVQLSRSADSVF